MAVPGGPTSSSGSWATAATTIRSMSSCLATKNRPERGAEAVEPLAQRLGLGLEVAQGPFFLFDHFKFGHENLFRTVHAPAYNMN